MDKKRLLEMAENPDFIPGIYNYCDRWCERCAFTSRCLTYAALQESSFPPGGERTDEMSFRGPGGVIRSCITHNSLKRGERDWKRR